MTPEEHIKQAERLAEEGDVVMNADHGIYASMMPGERVQRRIGAYLGVLAHTLLAAADE